jgi:uncharacterized glyoxalase superfamily protein PhnB
MAVKPIPDGYHTVTPYLTVADAAGQIEFVKQAFNAGVTELIEGKDGGVMHAEVRIGDSIVMIGQASEPAQASPAKLYLYVEETDALYHQAMKAGATSLMEPANQFYGDRNAGVSDPNGNQWWIATHVEDVAPEELQRRAAAQGK